jgi:CRP/FNR family transcriptional regulator, dissimilatory nitrate respiration regulator
MRPLHDHPEANIIRAQLRQNVILRHMSAEELAELERDLVVVDCAKGDRLLEQGAVEMEQYFLLDGILKRVVANADGREMILRFADAGGIESSYAAWRLKTRAPFSIVTLTKARVAKLPLPEWAAFMERHVHIKEVFEYEVMQLMSEIMAHTITLHLLAAPGRVHRFMRKHPEFANRVPKKELASYLNLSAETLSRLRQRGKI